MKFFRHKEYITHYGVSRSPNNCINNAKILSTKVHYGAIHNYKNINQHDFKHHQRNTVPS